MSRKKAATKLVSALVPGDRTEWWEVLEPAVQRLTVDGAMFKLHVRYPDGSVGDRYFDGDVEVPVLA